MTSATRVRTIAPVKASRVPGTPPPFDSTLILSKSKDERFAQDRPFHRESMRR